MQGLRRCVALDASDPRSYVVLGKLLVMQKRYDEARTLYQDGCKSTGAAAAPHSLNAGTGQGRLNLLGLYYCWD